jgi:hypothetical protein
MHISHIHEAVVAHHIEHFHFLSTFHRILPVQAVRQFDEIDEDLHRFEHFASVDRVEESLVKSLSLGDFSVLRIEILCR